MHIHLSPNTATEARFTGKLERPEIAFVDGPITLKKTRQSFTVHVPGAGGEKQRAAIVRLVENAQHPDFANRLLRRHRQLDQQRQHSSTPSNGETRLRDLPTPAGQMRHGFGLHLDDARTIDAVPIHVSQEEILVPGTDKKLPALITELYQTTVLARPMRHRLQQIGAAITGRSSTLPLTTPKHVGTVATLLVDTYRLTLILPVSGQFAQAPLLPKTLLVFSHGIETAGVFMPPHGMSISYAVPSGKIFETPFDFGPPAPYASLSVLARRLPTYCETRFDGETLCLHFKSKYLDLPSVETAAPTATAEQLAEYATGIKRPARQSASSGLLKFRRAPPPTYRLGTHRDLELESVQDIREELNDSGAKDRAWSNALQRDRVTDNEVAWAAFDNRDRSLVIATVASGSSGTLGTLIHLLTDRGLIDSSTKVHVLACRARRQSGLRGASEGDDAPIREGDIWSLDQLLPQLRRPTVVQQTRSAGASLLEVNPVHEAQLAATTSAGADTTTRRHNASTLAIHDLLKNKVGIKGTPASETPPN